MHLADTPASSPNMRRCRLFRSKPVIFVLLVALLLVLFLAVPISPSRSTVLADSQTFLHSHLDSIIPGKQAGYKFQQLLHTHNYALTSSQCDSHFPGLFEEIDKSVAHRRDNPIHKYELDEQGDDKSNTRVLIYDGDLYIISDGDVPVDERTYSVLHDLHRALIADPERHTIPNIEFIVGREDWVDGNSVIWGFTKKSDDQESWIVPDFGYWTWATPSVGSYQSVRRRIQEVEAQYPSFHQKDPRLIWRGSVDVGDGVRQALVNASVDKSWADVEKLDWPKEGGLPNNLLFIEDHCKYQFIAQTEGNSYSGRQKYIHNCNSVVVSHELEWVQPFHKFMVSDGPKQNFVLVNREFSDLDEKMRYYVEHPDVAARIADNNVRTFRDRYLTPAAQACYWRKLVRGYASVSYQPELYHDGENATMTEGTRPDMAFMHRTGRKYRGTPWENYVVNGALDSKFPRKFGYGCVDEEAQKKAEEERKKAAKEGKPIEGEAKDKDQDKAKGKDQGKDKDKDQDKAKDKAKEKEKEKTPPPPPKADNP